MRKFGMNNSFASLAKQSLLAIFLSIALVACGGDSGTSVNEDDSSLSSWSSEGTIGSSSSKKGDAGTSAGSVTLESGMTSSSQKIASSSSVKTVSSSSSVILSSSEGSSNSKPSSSSVIPASSGNLPSSSSKKDGGSSSAMTESSSSEYVPFDHSNTLVSDWYVGENAYKQFTDPRNGRSYYYIKIIGKDQVGDKDSVTIMAENLNVGKMVLGAENQNNDSEIERYCYNNDTTKCDEFGGLYQWAEMMQLPSRCNTESCADLIEENHRGICPEGWRLMTYKDFYIAWHAESNDHGIEGVRSSYGFNGYNSTGLSLIGAGLRTAEGKFSGLYEKIALFRPEEYEDDKNIRAHHSLISAQDDSAPQKNHRELKTKGFSVRCVKLE